jgi:hypothetical protein
MNLSKIQNSTLNLNNVSTNQDDGGLAGMEMVSQLLDISNFNNTSCILPPTPTNNNLVTGPQVSKTTHTSGRKDSCTSPKTARFSSF